MAASVTYAADGASAADHEVTASGSVTAVDLDHGNGSAGLSVRRVWQGSEGTQRHLGFGWGDVNVLRLTPDLRRSNALVARGSGLASL